MEPIFFLWNVQHQNRAVIDLLSYSHFYNHPNMNQYFCHSSWFVYVRLQPRRLLFGLYFLTFSRMIDPKQALVFVLGLGLDSVLFVFTRLLFGGFRTFPFYYYGLTCFFINRFYKLFFSGFCIVDG